MGREFDIIENYVAVWNEADPDERRRRIRSVWAPDGSTCYRLLDAHGYDAIEERVRGSWDKWLSAGKHVFRPKRAAAHHDSVKLDFVMLTVPEGRVEANGLCFLLLDAEGRIRRDYQFNPTTNEPSDIVDRYLASWNEPDAEARSRRITELWRPDGVLVCDTAVRQGRAAIIAEAAATYDLHGRRGRAVSSANATHAHHNLVKFKWRVAGETDEAISAGTELLILGDDGRIGCSYRFEEAV
jgi:hypothetical protein